MKMVYVLTAVESEGLKQADAWYVESFTVLNDEGKKWYCPCNQWLSLYHKDCQVCCTHNIVTNTHFDVTYCTKLVNFLSETY